MSALVGDLELPHYIGPCEFGRFGGWITVRCPCDLDPLMQLAGGLWDPAGGRWCITPRRIGAVIYALSARRSCHAVTNLNEGP